MVDKDLHYSKKQDTCKAEKLGSQNKNSFKKPLLNYKATLEAIHSQLLPSTHDNANTITRYIISNNA